MITREQMDKALDKEKRANQLASYIERQTNELRKQWAKQLLDEMGVIIDKTVVRARVYGDFGNPVRCKVTHVSDRGHAVLREITKADEYHKGRNAFWKMPEDIILGDE